jgi:hypothetical protein
VHKDGNSPRDSASELAMEVKPAEAAAHTCLHPHGGGLAPAESTVWRLEHSLEVGALVEAVGI